MVGLDIIFVRLREVELVVDVARDENSWRIIFICLFVSVVGLGFITYLVVPVQAMLIIMHI